jgi:hypothetical protein
MQKKKGGFNAPAPLESVVDTVGQAPEVQSPFSQQAAEATNPLAAPIDLAAAPAVQAPQADASAEVAGDPNILGAQTPESTIEPFVGNTQTADMRGQDIKKSPIDPTAQPGQGGPQFAERGSPQDFFLSQTNDGTTALSPEKITRGQEYAKQQGLNFDPTTGFSQNTEAPQVQAPQVQAPQGLTTAGGQPLAEFLAGGQQLDAQGRMIDPRVDRMSFDLESRIREAGQAARPDFGQAQTRAAGTVTDRERRAARGDDISDADRRDIAKANQQGASASDVARGDKVAAANGVDRKTGKSLVSPMTPSDILAREKWEDEKSKSGELTTADKNFLLAERKYNDILAKEQEGTPLTAAEELARERFEYDKDRDAKSDAAGPDKSSTERNIDTMMKARPGMSYADAADIVLNVVSKTTDPLSGRTAITNIAEGTSTPMESTQPQAISSLDFDPLPQGTSLFSRGQKYTGAANAITRGAQRVGGQLGANIASDENIQTAKDLDAFQGKIARAFQDDNKFSTGQDKILREEMDIKLSALTDPKTFKNNAISLDRIMRQRHADLLETANDLTMDSTFRAEAKERIKLLKESIRDLGVPQETPPTEGDTPPEGINPEAAKYWSKMSKEERTLFSPQAK